MIRFNACCDSLGFCACCEDEVHEYMDTLIRRCSDTAALRPDPLLKDEPALTTALIVCYLRDYLKMTDKYVYDNGMKELVEDAVNRCVYFMHKNMDWPDDVKRDSMLEVLSTYGYLVSIRSFIPSHLGRE